MAALLGTWKSDPSTAQNFDAWAKQSGLPADMIEKIRTDDTVEVWTQDGDTYSCTVKSKVWPEKTYKFKFGEETTDTDPFGGGVKYTINKGDDGKITEVMKTEMLQWKETKVMRDIKGDKMHVVHEVDGVQMKVEMNKC